MSDRHPSPILRLKVQEACGKRLRLRGWGGKAMRESNSIGLRARAGPRIAAFPDSVIERTRPADSWRSQFRRPRHFGFRSIAELNPWPLLRRRPLQAWKWLLPIALSLSIVILFTGLPFYFAFLPPSFPAFLAWRSHNSAFTRSRRHALRLQQLLDANAPLDELREDCEKTLSLDPDNDAARLILAAILIQDEQDRSALLQLAPLRDHRPESGEVVLLAAACYLHLGRPHAALHMLDALEEASANRSAIASLSLRRAALRQAGVTRRSELLRPSSPLAEELFDEDLY